MTEQRIKKLEKLVKVLCERVGVEITPCTHPNCDMTGGYWQDGNECGHCDGTQFIVLKEEEV